MINKRLNIITGISGLVFIAADLIYHVFVWFLMRFKWISYSLAFRLADSNGLFFALMLFLTLILSVTSLAALVSNLIMFTQADFFLRLALTTLGFFLPFIHSEDFGSFLIEAVFIGLFLLYLYKNNYRKQDTTEFENYKQM